MLSDQVFQDYAKKIGISQMALIKPVEYPNYKTCINERIEYRHLRYKPFESFIDSTKPANYETLIVLLIDYFVSNKYPEGYLKISNYSRYLWQTANPRVKQIQEFLIDQGYSADLVNVPDKATACLAGLGLIGMNTIFYAYGLGSYVGIIVLGTNYVPQKYQEPKSERVNTAKCMQCKLCIKACPMGAIHTDGYRINPFRCISFINRHMMETYRSWPEKIENLDNWIGGCEACQDVCPMNIQIEHQQDVIIEDLNLFGMRLKNTDSISKTEMAIHVNEIIDLDYKEIIKTIINAYGDDRQ